MIIVSHCPLNSTKRLARQQGLEFTFNTGQGCLDFKQNNILMAFYYFAGESKHRIGLRDKNGIGHFFFDLWQCTQEKLLESSVLRDEDVITFVTCRELVERFLEKDHDYNRP